jgi:hypothetical protein
VGEEERREEFEVPPGMSIVIPGVAVVDVDVVGSAVLEVVEVESVFVLLLGSSNIIA